MISDIQHFSTGDGPGIRTTVFLKGCNLRCLWCHNPETISKDKQLQYFDQLCTRCGGCERACPVGVHKVAAQVGHLLDRKKCIACGDCETSCPEGALRLCGKELSVEAVMSYILEDKEFYQISGGGVTLSGGEPLLQPDFCAAIARECKISQLHVIIDTAGNVDYEAFQAVIPYTDVFYFDVKAATEHDYQEWTGGSFKKTMENLTRLINDGCEVVVRIPIIPGYNDSPEYCEKMAKEIKSAGAKQVHLIPFHRMGTGKYHALGKMYSCENINPPSKEHMEKLKEIFDRYILYCKLEG